jgi:hypothetical protein
MEKKMGDILKELQKIWPAGAGLLVLILAYVGARKIASPKDWKSLRNLLWNHLALSLDISATKLVSSDTVLITLGYLRKSKPYHHNDYNSTILDLYEKCMRYQCCFWWSDRSLPLFMVTIVLCIALFKLEPIWAAICVVIYFATTLLAADTAKGLEKSVDEKAKNSEKTQKGFLNKTSGNVHELT